ncbi:transposase [Ornithinibacillus salinisoli]|uniref:Transposase n=1 Tax=Ornithinibacillus salinisoli TaxID=1848459 RepID=A0ABW4W086_9BACI
MGKQRKLYSRYSKETKLEAIRRVLVGDEPVQQVIADLGIRHRDNVYEWIKKYKEHGVSAFDRKLKEESTESQLKELKAEVAALKRYVEIVVQGAEEKYQAVDELKSQFSVETLCNALDISTEEFMQYKMQQQNCMEDEARRKKVYLHRNSCRVSGH